MSGRYGSGVADETPIEDQIQYAVEDGIARVTINRPEAGNSLTSHMRDTLADTFDELSATLGVRAVVLTGAGERHFCTGAGLGGPQKPGPERPADAPDRALGDVARMIRRGWQRLIASILDCEKPVIAAVNGTAAGGGANLVLACDLVVMADTRGSSRCSCGAASSPTRAAATCCRASSGCRRRRRSCSSATTCPAAEAERLGIANQVVPGGRGGKARRRVGPVASPRRRARRSR